MTKDLLKKFLIAGAALRLLLLGAADFWYDEGVTVVFSRLPLDRLIDATAADVHPPLYYLLPWSLEKLGLPLTEIVARFPSVLLSILAIYLTYLLAERLDLSREGKLVAVAWVTISPLQLHYAQEARMYALLQTLVLASFLMVLDRRYWVLAALLTAALYTHNYGLFYAPALALVAAIREGWDWDRLLLRAAPWNNWQPPVAISFLLPVIAWVPWLRVLLGQMGTISGGYWIQPVSAGSVLYVFYKLFYAFNMPHEFIGVGVMMTGGLLTYTSWKIYKDRPPHYQVLLAVIVTPLALAVLMSLAWRPLLLFRGLIGTAVPLLLLVVKALEGVAVPYKRLYAYGMIAVVMVAGMVGHYQNNPGAKGNTQEWISQLVQEYEAGDAVLALNDNGVIAMKTYAPQLEVYKMTGCGEEALGSLAPGVRAALGIREREAWQLQANRVIYISTLAPVSSKCEAEADAELLGAYPKKQLIELSNDEYTTAGVYMLYKGY